MCGSGPTNRSQQLERDARRRRRVQIRSAWLLGVVVVLRLYSQFLALFPGQEALGRPMADGSRPLQVNPAF